MNRLRSIRVRELIEKQGRIYHPPRSDTVNVEHGDGDNQLIGIRITTNILEIFNQTAQVALLDYADEEMRTLDSVLLSEADYSYGYIPTVVMGDEVYA